MENSQRLILCLDRYLPTEHALNSFEALSEGNIINIRVAWDGDRSVPGTFQVQNLDRGWDNAGNLSPGSPLNDVFYGAFTPGEHIVRLHIQRGPEHGESPFEALVHPIQWTKNLPSVPGHLPRDFTAERQNHYNYAGPEPLRFTSKDEGGVQTITLALDFTTNDYELWVRLQHPTDDNAWSIMDPIIAHKDRGGAGSSSRDDRAAS